MKMSIKGNNMAKLRFVLSCLLILVLTGCSSLKKNSESYDWPNTWAIFGPVPATSSLLTIHDISKLKQIPSLITVAGKQYKAKVLHADDRKLDFFKAFFPEQKKNR